MIKNDIDTELDLKEAKELIPELGTFSGKLNNSEKLLEFLEKDTRVSRLLDKLRSYAYLKLLPIKSFR